MLNPQILDFEAARIHNAALAEGMEQGMAEGMEQGMAKGLKIGDVRGTVFTLRSLGWDEPSIARKLTELWDMSAQEAIDSIQAFNAQRSKS